MRYVICRSGSFYPAEDLEAVFTERSANCQSTCPSAAATHPIKPIRTREGGAVVDGQQSS